MFHPGKILGVYKEKNNTQASIEMWDENLFTFHVSPAIADKIKKDDIVLVDYRPLSDKVPIPKQTIIKIISPKDNIWKVYKSYYSKKKTEAKTRGKKMKVLQTPSFAG